VQRILLDLRGEVCPYTFVRAKLALEELEFYDEMEILVDHRPAFSSLPRALREEGCNVLSTESVPSIKSDETFRIVVCKNPLDESV
jgi:tRNA 2-thiouridine synthesizing protein A